MAAGAALKKINARVKQLAKKYPKKKRVSLQKQAGAEYRAGKLKAKKRRIGSSGNTRTATRASTSRNRTATKTITARVAIGSKRRKRRRVGALSTVGASRRKRRATRKRAARRLPAKVIIMKVGSTKRRRRRSVKRKSVVRRRRVSGAGKIMGIKTSTLLIAGLGLGALYLFSRKPSTVYVPTGNVQRDTKAQQIVNYAIAAGATATAIANLIKSMQTKSDAQVDADYSAAQQGQLMIA